MPCRITAYTDKTFEFVSFVLARPGAGAAFRSSLSPARCPESSPAPDPLQTRSLVADDQDARRVLLHQKGGGA